MREVHHCVNTCSLEFTALKASLPAVMGQSETWRSQFETRPSESDKAKDHLYVNGAKHIPALRERETESSAALIILQGRKNNLDTSLSSVRGLLACLTNHVNLPSLEALPESLANQGTVASQEEADTTSQEDTVTTEK